MNFKARGDDLGLDESEYRELIDLFIESCGADIQLLQKALAAGDAQEVSRCAHTIKGASSNLGLNEVSTAAGYIENLVPNDQWADLAHNVKLLKDRFEAILAEVRLS
jgi:histidine phosphotransfer protein HptB